ncbi:MAG: molybdopterin-dependent oxidoreductase [Anaerolineae bacterium]|nr:molybdopterin-dependent oxidoreductase [Anaerolineae bacterium]
MDQSVTLKIDGRDVTVPAGTTVLDAARMAGIEIPSLCNHAKLLPAGLCRLCLVEIEKMRGLQPACASVVREGMVVRTDTPAVLHNRRMVLELLCTNHPLDCPVCDAAGDCRLQDYVFVHGRARSRFVETKRHKGKAIRLGPAVILDQERCVLCQRCVRFCDEILDDQQLAVFQRGASSRIATLPGAVFDSPFSGNVVDLCPVGALTDRTFRFKARAWELKGVPSVCALCPVGCRMTLEGRADRVLRVRGREAPEVNDGWLCDLGRTGYGFTEHVERLRRPLVRRGGRLEAVTWDEALAEVARGLGGVVGRAGPQALAVLGSPRLSNEAAYLLGRLARALGTNNVDGRLGTAAPAPAQASLKDLRQAEVVLLFQADPSHEAPILELWVKQAVRRGARLYVVHPRALHLDRYAAAICRPKPGSEAVLLAGVLAAVEKARPGALPEDWRPAVAGLGPTQVASLTGCGRDLVKTLAEALQGTSRAILAYGAGVRQEETLGLLTALAQATGARLLGWDGGPNSRGVADVGLLPHHLPGRAPLGDPAATATLEQMWQVRLPGQPGLGSAGLWSAMQSGQVQALYLAAADPLSEAPQPQLVEEALRAASFLVVQESFLSATAGQFAHVVLPAAVPGEEEGSLTNLAGIVGWQRALVSPLGASRPHWRIVADVARALAAPGAWEYAQASDVLAELARAVPAYGGVEAITAGGSFDARYEYTAADVAPAAPSPAKVVGGGDLALLSGPMLFDRDVMTRHARGVADRAPEGFAAIHPADAERLGVTDGACLEVRGVSGALVLRARVTDACAQGTVFVPEQLSEPPVNRLGAEPGVVVMVEVKPSGARPER